ncbi:MAG: hypothetical protein EZS28_040661, partial [Streblomastix strix]
MQHQVDGLQVDIFVILILRQASLSTVACNCVPLSFFPNPSFPFVKFFGSIACSDQSLSSLSFIPSAMILSISFVNCSWSSLSVSDSTICCAANVIKPITASGIDWFIWGCMLMNPATPSRTFSNPGMNDPFGRFAQASRLSVSQRQQGTTPSRTSPSNCFHCSSERFRSLGLRIGVWRLFMGGQKKAGRFLVILLLVPFLYILMDLREKLFLIQLMFLSVQVSMILCGDKCDIAIPGSSGIRKVYCCRYAGIGGIIRF